MERILFYLETSSMISHDSYNMLTCSTILASTPAPRNVTRVLWRDIGKTRLLVGSRLLLSYHPHPCALRRFEIFSYFTCIADARS